MTALNKQAQAIISDIRLKRGSGDVYAPIIRLDEFEVITGALEAAEKRIAEHSFENRLLANADRDIKALRQRIAELEAGTVVVKQFDDFQIVHYGATEDYAKGYIDCQNNYNKALTAAGIGVKGE